MCILKDHFSPPWTANLQAYFTYLEESPSILCKPLLLESLFLRVKPNPYSLPWDLMKLNGSHLTKSPSCFKVLLWFLGMTLKRLSMVLKALYDMCPLPLQPWLSHCTPPCHHSPGHSSPCHPGISHFWSFAHATLFSRILSSLPWPFSAFNIQIRYYFLQEASQDLHRLSRSYVSLLCWPHGTSYCVRETH